MGEILRKDEERMLRWYGCVMTRWEDYVGQSVMGIEIQVKSKPK